MSTATVKPANIVQENTYAVLGAKGVPKEELRNKLDQNVKRMQEYVKRSGNMKIEEEVAQQFVLKVNAYNRIPMEFIGKEQEVSVRVNGVEIDSFKVTAPIDSVSKMKQAVYDYNYVVADKGGLEYLEELIEKNKVHNAISEEFLEREVQIEVQETKIPKM